MAKPATKPATTKPAKAAPASEPEPETPVLPERDALLAAAADLVETMPLVDTALNEDLTDVPDDEIADAIKEASADLYGTDNLKEAQKQEDDDAKAKGRDAQKLGVDRVAPETKAVLQALGCDPGVGVRSDPPAPAAKGGKKDKPPKVAKPPKEKKDRKPSTRDFSTSNKAVVFGAWKKGEKDVPKLEALVESRVKAATIKSWLAQWAHDKNLPAIATKA